MTPSASLRLFAFTKLAGLALAQLRTITDLAGSVCASAFPNRALMVQPGPRAVIVVASTYPLPVEISHRGSSCVEITSTTGALQGCFTLSAENLHRSRGR